MGRFAILSLLIMLATACGTTQEREGTKARRARKDLESVMRLEEPETVRYVLDEIDSADGQVPPHQIAERKDISIGHLRRWRVRVSLPEHYARDKIELVSKAIVDDITRQVTVNAIVIFFYGPTTEPRGIFDVAKAEWAPNGNWLDLDKVSSGEYSSFKYSVTYIPPR